MNKRLVPKFNKKTEREEFWHQVCQDFISSGLSKTAYCDKRNISDSSLYRWLDNFKDILDFSQQAINKNMPEKKQRTTPNTKSAPKTSFLPIQVKQQVPSATRNLSDYAQSDAVTQKHQLHLAEIVFHNGIRLILNQELNVDLLSQLMQVMG
jgi:hypothetical protein